jgi:hypothetical protein
MTKSKSYPFLPLKARGDAYMEQLEGGLEETSDKERTSREVRAAE